MKKLAFVFAVALAATGLSSATVPQKASAATVICRYFPAEQIDGYHAGYYWWSPEYPNQLEGGC